MKPRLFLSIAVLLICTCFRGTAQPAGQSPAQIVVPCPAGVVDSSSAITKALLSVQPGGTVLLEEGKYYLARAVDVTTSFRGKLRGAGMDKTVVTTLPSNAPGWEGKFDVLMPNWISDLDSATPGTRGPTTGPTLFHFLVPQDGFSDVTISDLTIDVGDPAPAIQSLRGAWFGGVLLALITVEGQKANTDFDRIVFRGAEGSFNCFYAIEIWGELTHWQDGFFVSDKPMIGAHTIRRCRFEHGTSTSLNPVAMKDSRVTVLENTFTNQVPGIYGGLVALGLDGVSLHVINNDFEISGTGSYSLSVGDPVSPELNPPECLVSGNRFRGRGQYGIVMWTGQSSMLLNNELADFTVEPRLGTSGIPMFLNAPTNNNLVVGASPGTVLDLGTNNRIVASQKQ